MLLVKVKQLELGVDVDIKAIPKKDDEEGIKCF
jgi:hypothetical protein